jgi:tetratricopeptide (TPR) repeat protein
LEESTAQHVIAPFAPYRQSALWAIHDEYFARRGTAPWREGEIPHRSTSNRAFARQHAQIVLAAMRRRPLQHDEVTLMEVGGGSGLFAAHLLDALDRDCGVEGRLLLGRLRYLFTDYAEPTVREAIESPLLRRFVESGRLVPALFDLRASERPRRLDGAPFFGVVGGVIANYVACVAPTTFLRKSAGGSWSELEVELFLDGTAEGPPPALTVAELLAACRSDGVEGLRLAQIGTRYRWRPAALAELFTGPLHAAVAERALEGRESGTFAYPFGFLDFLGRAAAWLGPAGFVLVSDYGSPEQTTLADGAAPRPMLYGDSLNHGVQFALLDAYAPLAGWSLARTSTPLSSLQHALLVRGATLAPELRDAFRGLFVERQEGADLLDFAAAARALAAQEDHVRAARFLARAARLDPRDAQLQYELGQQCVKAGEHRLAIEHLLACARLDGGAALDHEFELGLAHYHVGAHGEAIAWYERALAKAEHPAIHWNLALALHALGDLPRTRRALKAALALEPEHAAALALVEELKQAWWQQEDDEGAES